jgi:hypothetical protein
MYIGNRIAKAFLFLAPLLIGTACQDTKMHSLADDVWMVKIVVDPLKGAYDINDTIDVDYVVLDWYGNSIQGIGATWQKPPASDVAFLGGKSYQFEKIGAFSWTVTLDQPYGLSDSITLQVPAVPGSVDITVDPAQDYYVVGDQVTLGYVVYDQEGHPMTGIGASWQNPPSSGARAEGNGLFSLLQEGYLTWTVTLDAPYNLSDSETLAVDGSGPSVEIEVPERGDTILDSGATPEVTVRGHLNDAVSGVAGLSISTNTTPACQATVQADGSFSLATQAAQGLNVVEVDAVDLAGNHTIATRAYHYSGDFFAYQNDSQGRTEIAQAASDWLTDKALDRGKPTDNPSYDPCGPDASGNYVCSEIRDIASLLELALNNIDFATSQPGQNFNYPIIDQAWQFDLTSEINVKATLDGDFDLDLGFDHITAGLAKVLDLSSRTGGVHAGFSYDTFKDSAGQDHPGLDVSYGLTATLTFNIWLDLTATDPLVQVGLCLLADNLCNSNPPYDCLSDYLVACNAPGQATPVAQSISYIDTPVLVGLAVDQMLADLDLDIGLDSSKNPQVALANLDINLGQATLDVSALEDITINIGTLHFASFEIDLGTWNFPSTFISDLANQLLNPLVNALKPVIEYLLDEFFTCADPQNPVCYVMPFFEDFFSAFAIDKDVQIENPFDTSPSAPPLASAHFLTKFSDLLFAQGHGSDLTLVARISSNTDPDLLQHRDDDFLGLALTDGCLVDEGDFTGYDIGDKSIQIAPAIDLANMVLFAIWNNGGFDLDLDASHFNLPQELDVSSLSVNLKPWLPPMLTACGRDNEEILAELGDLRIEGELTTQAGNRITFSGFASLMIPAQLRANAAAGGIEINLADAPEFSAAEIDSLSIDGQAADSAVRGSVTSLIKDQLAVQLLRAFADIGLGQIGVLVPSFDISAFLGQAAGSAEMTIGDFEIHQDQSHAIANGDLVY